MKWYPDVFPWKCSHVTVTGLHLWEINIGIGLQVMVWCRQATSLYLNRWWPRFMLQYGVPMVPLLFADVQGWLKVIGLFILQLAINRVIGYRTCNSQTYCPCYKCFATIFQIRTLSRIATMSIGTNIMLPVAHLKHDFRIHNVCNCHVSLERNKAG